MNRRCDRLREQALSGGLDSRAGLAWRIHCRSCEDCRTELFILETLERQALSERNHLGRREVAVLMARVQELNEARRPVSAFWTWGVRAASVAAVIFVIGILPRSNTVDFPGMEGALASVGRQQSACAAAPSSSPTEVSAGVTGVVPGTAASSALSPGTSCQRRIRNLRRRIDARRENLLKLLEHELGDSLDQDVWDAPRQRVDLALV